MATKFWTRDKIRVSIHFFWVYVTSNELRGKIQRCVTTYGLNSGEIVIFQRNFYVFPRDLAVRGYRTLPYLSVPLRTTDDNWSVYHQTCELLYFEHYIGTLRVIFRNFYVIFLILCYRTLPVPVRTSPVPLFLLKIEQLPETLCDFQRILATPRW